MEEDRREAAKARIEAALARINAATSNLSTSANGGSSKVMALINKHEALREDVADTLRDLDKLIADLES